jgi:hypothetical protein
MARRKDLTPVGDIDVEDLVRRRDAWAARADRLRANRLLDQQPDWFELGVLERIARLDEQLATQRRTER